MDNFDVPLNNYEAYDKDRVPFVIDVLAFFRIANTNVAAQRVAGIDHLKAQLDGIVKGAIRKILASHDINQIMIDRATFGQAFTDEVKTELENWGVEPVKNIELMDIRDAENSKVIHNIMAKKSSHIEMESRMEVANNRQAAETAEIAAKQTVDVRAQEAEQTVGERTAEKDQKVGIAQQLANQEVLDKEKETKVRFMAVQQVEQVRQAEIDKAKELVLADKDKLAQILRADGALQAKKLEAEGVEALGKAEGEAEKARLMAPVSAQIELANKIAQLAGYQNYLAMVKAIEAYVVVGGKQAEALKAANIKVIANAGSPTEGVRNVMDLFSSKGGTELSAMIEAFAQTPMGENIMSKLVGMISSSAGEAPENKSPGTPEVIEGQDD